MNFSDYKDAQDFLQKSGLDPDSAITFLDTELKKIGEENEEERRNKRIQRH